MTVPATASYAALLTLLFIALSIRVIGRRRSDRVAIGVAGASVLGRLSHAWGVSRAAEDFRFRVAGIGTTFSVLGILSLLVAATGSR